MVRLNRLLSLGEGGGSARSQQTARSRNCRPPQQARAQPSGGDPPPPAARTMDSSPQPAPPTGGDPEAPADPELPRLTVMQVEQMKVEAKVADIYRVSASSSGPRPTRGPSCEHPLEPRSLSYFCLFRSYSAYCWPCLHW